MLSTNNLGLALYSRSRAIINRWWMKRLARRFGHVGARSFIAWPVDSLTNLQHVFIGDEVRIGAQVRLDVVRANPESAFGRIEIGDRTIMMERCSIASAVNVHVEHDVLFGANVAVRDSEHGFSVFGRHRGFEPLVRAAPVSIGAYTWIGQNAVILKGVSIGRNAVVGANAVVTASVAEGAVVAGVPARQIAWADGHPFANDG